MPQHSGDYQRIAHPLLHAEERGDTPTSPRQLHVGEISIRKAIELNSLWHSRLPAVKESNIARNRHFVCFGAEHGGIFYACAIWTDPIARLLNGKNWLELRRFAIAPDAPPNTASRLLSVMRRMIAAKWPHIERLISYQDTAVHTGTIYKAAGWTATVKNRDWTWQRPNRVRDTEQAPSEKVRWELALR